jgi:hypothetical protein
VWVWLALTASRTHCGGGAWSSISVIVVVGTSSFDAHIVKLCCNQGNCGRGVGATYAIKEMPLRWGSTSLGY